MLVNLNQKSKKKLESAVAYKIAPQVMRGSGFDVVNAINSITPKGIEFHIIDQADDGSIKKASFCGPNTNLPARLEDYDNKTGTYKSIITPPINKLDEGALQHDVAYHNKNLSARHEADRQLIKVADSVINDINAKSLQKMSANVVKIILTGKLKLGLGIS